MTVQVSYPGVYISEFTPGAPIVGTGPGTAAFVGPAGRGPSGKPTKITKWEDFLDQFGTDPVPRTFLWYAVRGFFENGGQTCYIARVTNEAFDQLTLKDPSGADTIVVRARQAGQHTPPIKVAVESDVHSVPATVGQVFRPTAQISTANGTSIQMTSVNGALQFRAGDSLTWNTRNEPEPTLVLRVEGQTLTLQRPLTRSYQSTAATALTLRLAEPATGQTTVRLIDSAALGAGSVIALQPRPTGTLPPPQIHIVRSVDVERITPSLTTYRVELRDGLRQPLPLGDPVTVESYEFRLTVRRAASPAAPAYSKVYDELGMDPEHRNYFAKVINLDQDGLIRADPIHPPNTNAPPADRPDQLSPAANLTGGRADDPSNHADDDYKTALRQLEKVDDVDLVAVPDRTGADVQLALIGHCTRLKDRLAILDSDQGSPPFGTGSVEAKRPGWDTTRGYAAVYYPWLLVPPAGAGQPLLVPPSGHVAGIFSRTDQIRGVHKAPAGEEAIVEGALGVEPTMSDVDQGLLNLKGINVIRVFAAGGRPRIWGARTTATDTNWQYVNVRRLMLFLEKSIQQGIRWAVFEPNGLDLWQQLKRTIGDFLTKTWRDGALFGETAKDAFYVRIDEVLNPFPEQQLGRLNIEIGVRPAYPAEFIVVRIGISPVSAQIEE